MAAIRIGISGWRYKPRRGDFYPEGLMTPDRELQFASRAVNSIEINGSFYALQTPQRYADALKNVVFIKVRAPFDARSLLRRLGLDTALAPEPGKPPAPGVLP